MAVTPWIYASKGNLRGQHRGEYIDELGQWFDGLADWKWFITRTLGGETDMGFTQPGIGMARRCLRDLLVRTEATDIVAVFELQQRGVPHIHALVRNERATNGGLEQERDFNKYGIARWKAYRKGKGASYYLGKYLGKEMIELYIGLDGPYSELQLEGRKLDKLRC